MSTYIKVKRLEVESKINACIFDGRYSIEKDSTILLGIEDEGFDENFLRDVKDGLNEYMRAAGMYFTRAKSEEGEPMVIVHIPRSCFRP